MWIVKLALKRPYTVADMALLILVLGPTSIRQMRTDVFPDRHPSRHDDLDV